jgi:NAD(P)-dependent dehydrogenase (short-subunit alcohol dehydrogenase family)
MNQSIDILKDYHPASNLLTSRHIVVTGADYELGDAVARAVAAHGATAILIGRDQPTLEKLYDEIAQSGAPEPALLPFDLWRASADDFDALGATLSGEFDELDGLAHCAVDLGILSPLAVYDLSIWVRVIQANLNVPYLMTRVCLPLLEKAESASVVFTSSDVGRIGRPNWGAYGVSCFALEGLMQTWAVELEGDSSVRINTLDPGPLRTAMRARLYPGEDPETVPTPADIATAYLYLLGPDSEGLSGRSLSAHQGA